jgi:hypothetical protein
MEFVDGTCGWDLWMGLVDEICGWMDGLVGLVNGFVVGSRKVKHV